MDYRKEVMRNCPGFETDTLEKKLSLGGLGTAGEGGEVADVIKKILHHREVGVSVEEEFSKKRDKIIKEMGDVHWYLEYLSATLGVTTEEIKEANVKKLRERHPNGWTPKSQQEKIDEVSTETKEIDKKFMEEVLNRNSVNETLQGQGE